MEENTSTSKNKLKDYKNGEVSFGEFSWPPKFYSCGFCKREFRSAQALGGHMNVHRREKARLREISPYLYSQFQHLSSNSKFPDLKLTSNPNPNPNLNIKTCSAPKMCPFSDPCHRLSPPTSANFSTLRYRKSNLIGDGCFDDSSDHGKERMIVKKSKTDLFAELKFDHDLDLELRLGCS